MVSPCCFVRCFHHQWYHRAGRRHHANTSGITELGGVTTLITIGITEQGFVTEFIAAPIAPWHSAAASAAPNGRSLCPPLENLPPRALRGR